MVWSYSQQHPHPPAPAYNYEGSHYENHRNGPPAYGHEHNPVAGSPYPVAPYVPPSGPPPSYSGHSAHYIPQSGPPPTPQGPSYASQSGGPPPHGPPYPPHGGHPPPGTPYATHGGPPPPSTPYATHGGPPPPGASFQPQGGPPSDPGTPYNSHGGPPPPGAPYASQSGPPPPGTPYAPQGGPPSSNSPYVHQGSYSHPGVPYSPPVQHPSAAQYSTPSGHPPPGPPPPQYDHHNREHNHTNQNSSTHEYWNQSNIHHSRSWQYNNTNDPRKEEYDSNMDHYRSPERNEATAHPRSTSSSRGGRRPDAPQMPPPSKSHRGQSNHNNSKDLPLLPPTLLHKDRFASNDISDVKTSPTSTTKTTTKRGNESSKKEKVFSQGKPSTEKVKHESGDDSKQTTSQEQNSDQNDEDPLALLANVSSEVNTDKASKKKRSEVDNTSDSNKKKEGSERKVLYKKMDEREANATEQTPAEEPPTSPLQRQVHASPMITPNISREGDQFISSKDEGKQSRAYQPPKHRVVRTLTPKPITPTGAPHYHHYQPKAPKTPVSSTPYEERAPPSALPYYGNIIPPTQRHPHPRPPYSAGPDKGDHNWENPHHSPAVVERNSFDSGESARHGAENYHYHRTPQVVPPYHRGEGAYPPPDTRPHESAWHNGSSTRNDRPSDTHTPPSPYPPPHLWPHDGPHPPPPPPSPGHASGGYYQRDGPPPPLSQSYPPQGPPPMQPPGYPTPSTYYPPPSDAYPYEGPQRSPAPNHPFSPPSHHMQYPMYPQYPPASYPPPNNVSPPYTYVQQQSKEGQGEKTVLRKKFSWKHFPELERFLIESRDDYLQFSNRNYTVEQKQFNNHLTERLIELADKNNYIFDPDDFNFVAIRDRIRCYYKSYVQTARKRGLSIPISQHGNSNKRLKHGDIEMDDSHSEDEQQHRSLHMTC